MSVFSRWLVCIGVLLFATRSQSVAAQWVQPPSKELQERTPGLVHETFESVPMRTTVGYSVVLPPDYGTSTRRFPVVYWLHGGGGNESSSLFTAKSWTDLFRNNKVGEVILVYPNGFRSGYMDHFDGKVMVESMIIQELIPRIDSTYRTIATRQGRAVHGFSMGASGALKFAFKYPNMFSAAVAYGGGAIDLETDTSEFIVNILKRNLNADPKLIRQNNTYHFLEQNGDSVRRNGTRFLLICGEDDSWRGSAVAFQAALQRKNIPCQLKLVPDIGHNLQGLSEAEGKAAAIFQDRVFREENARALRVATETGTTVTESYYSAAEGRHQSFQVVLPPGFEEDSSYPLVVQVFGGASLMPTRDRPFIRIRPSGRGVWGYRSMSRYDVMQAIARTKEKYNVDEDRVYMTGTSAGATGIMHVAAQRPDIFAGVVPLVAFGNDLPLENFCNLPIRCEHGVNDWTSAIGNVRVQFQKLKTLGYDAVLNEHSTAGHGISVPPPDTMDWLFKLRRNPSPKRIVYLCEHPRDGRANWVRIERFVDPHRVARIEAAAGPDGIQITTTNIRQFVVDLSTAPLQDGQKLTIDGQSVECALDASQSELAFMTDNGWQAAVSVNDKSNRTVYGAGAAANLFQGEPLLVVYGTGGDDREDRFLQQLASVLARSGGPTFKPANVRFLVRPDTGLSDLSLDQYNLLLVGTSWNNSLLERIAAELPYRIEDDVLHAADRKPLSLSGALVGFHYFNPHHPDRTIYVVSPFLNEGEEQQCLQNPRKFLAGSDGFRMIDQPDLFVRGVDLRIRREMQLDSDWNFIRVDGENRPIPERFADRAHLARAHMKVMQRNANVDFALWWGPQDKGLFGGYDFNWLPEFDPATYTFADYAIRRRETETMTAELPGTELQDIFDRWIAGRELITWPEISRQAIEADRRYSIVIPMDLVPKLGSRRRTLSNVAPGPAILPNQCLK